MLLRENVRGTSAGKPACPNPSLILLRFGSGFGDFVPGSGMALDDEEIGRAG